MKPPRKTFVAGAAALLMLSTASCVFREDDDDPELSQLTAQVEAFDFYFKSTTLVLEPSVEATITLVNSGSNLHSFTVPDFDVEVEAQGAETVSIDFVTPATPGSYEFFCKYHPEEMVGTVSIGGDADPVPAETEVEVGEDDEDDLDY